MRVGDIVWLHVFIDLPNEPFLAVPVAAIVTGLPSPGFVNLQSWTASVTNPVRFVQSGEVAPTDENWAGWPE